MDKFLLKRPPILTLAAGAIWVSACATADTDGLSYFTTVESPSPRLIATTGVTIKEIALYQAVKRPLMVDGERAKSDIPIVAGRDALLRVFVDVDASHDLVGRIYLDDDPTPIEIEQTIALSSTDEELDSTLNFDIPGAKLTPTTRYRVAVGELAVAPASVPDAPTYPATDPDADSDADADAETDRIPVEGAGETIKIVIAPISYNGIVPVLTEALLKKYQDGFYAMYPVSKVELSVRAEPIVWTETVDPLGNGWQELLSYVAEVRWQDGVGKDIYYYAPFTPGATLGAFCGRGCVAGLGVVDTSGDGLYSAAIGLGYGDDDSIDTALHEVGHNHGREHAPCGVAADDTDPAYPHMGGKDGVWGYDLLTTKLFAPDVTDIMGYCTPHWISDYTFKGLFTRIKQVNSAKRVIVPEAERNRLYDRVLVGADGTVKWLPSIRLDEPPSAEAKSIKVESAGFTETVKGSFYRFDHLDGGIAFWPASERKTQAIRIDVAAGKTVRLSR